MSHEHIVHDSDGYFTIDPISKEIINNTNGKTTVVQYDHNSEEFTFRIPRLIENHDTSKCDLIQIHYINESKGTSVSTRNSNAGVYTITKVTDDPDDDSYVIFPWLLTREATQFAGTIKFQLKFICYGDDDIADYTWSTKIFSSIEVAPAYNHTQIVVEEGKDVLLQFEQRISDLEENGVGGGDDSDDVKTVNGIAPDENGNVEIEATAISDSKLAELFSALH